jgi:acyl-CoA synthetase (NDP forming)
MSPEDLFAPDGIALVGASEDRHYPRSILVNLLAQGYPPERIYPIHPRHQSVLGLPCHRSLASLPAPPSLVVLATQRDTVPGLLLEAAEAGARAAVVLADGFAEQGPEGRRRQDELAAICRERDLLMLGPNTLGFIAPVHGVGVWAGGELSVTPRAGALAIVSQSSGTLNLLLAQAGHRHMGLSVAASVGNEAVLQAADLIAYLAQDQDTKVIACFLETATHPARLARALEAAAAAGKPVVTLKIGRSERARRNAVAHTGRMASSGAAWEALLERTGAVVVHDLDELLETSALFLHQRPVSGRGGLGIATISGGDCGLLADLCEELQVPLPEVGADTRAALVRALEKDALVGNPLDCENLRREDRSRFDAAIDALCREPAFDLVAFRMQIDYEPSRSQRELYGDLLARAAAAGRMAALLTRSVEPLGSAWFEFCEGLDVAFLPSYRTALASIGHFLGWRPRTSEPPTGVPEEMDEAEPEARTLGWAETQAWLAQAGIPYAPSRLAATPEAAAEAAAELGFPVALKVASAELAHKTESQGVRLGLVSAPDVQHAAEEMAGRHTDREGFEVQRMATGGVEMIVGMTRDPAVGPVLLAGTGGVLAELVADVALALPPLNELDALALIERLRGARLLHGYRGGAAADVTALARLLSGLSRFLVEQGQDVLEVDLNPVIVTPEGAVAVDALVRVRAAPQLSSAQSAGGSST